MTEQPNYAEVTRLWLTKYGKIQSYPNMCAFRGALKSSLILDDDLVEVRRVGPVLLVMPGAPQTGLRPGAVIELESDDRGEDFSATLTRAEVKTVICALPEDEHGPVRISLVNGALEVFHLAVSLSVPLTSRQRPAA